MPVGVRTPSGGGEQSGGLAFIEGLFGGKTFETPGVGEPQILSGMRQAEVWACEGTAGPSAPPCDHGPVEAGTEIGYLSVGGGVIPEKVVGDGFGWGVDREDIGVGGERPERLDAVFCGVGVVGGETADEHGGGHGGRGEVDDQREEGEHFLVPLRMVTGEAEEQVPLYLDMERAGVAERGDVRAGFDAFAHELEERGGEGFDAELDFLNLSVSQQGHALEVDVGFLFVKDDGLREFLSEAWEQSFEIGMGHDVIGHGNGSPGFFEHEFGQLVENAIGVFGAVDHTVPVEAAEGAVTLLTPPATSAGLVADEGFAGLVEGTLWQPKRELVPVFGGARCGDGIHIGLGTAMDHSWEGAGVGSPVAEELNERLFAFALEHMIDSGRYGCDAIGHWALAIRSAQEGERLRGALFDGGQQRDGGVGLLEHGGAPDDLGLSLRDEIGDVGDPGMGDVLHATEEVWVEADATGVEAGLSQTFADLGDFDFEVSALVMAEGRGIEGRASEHPFSGEHGDGSIGQVVIGGFAESGGEVDVGVEHAGRETLLTGDGLENV